MTTYTEQQIADFRRYERVQRSGRYNMLSREAVAAVGIGKDRHLFVIEHYDELDALVNKPLMV